MHIYESRHRRLSFAIHDFHSGSNLDMSSRTSPDGNNFLDSGTFNADIREDSVTIYILSNIELISHISIKGSNVTIFIVFLKCFRR